MVSPDRTTGAVAAQLLAMACERYEIGLRDIRRGVMILREWTADEIEHALPWLKRMNAHDHDVYIRPLGSVGLIVADDLTGTALTELTRDGLTPAVVVETSPTNYQAWLRVSADPIAEELATAAARVIAERYGTDPNSADWRHFGRLAGFTNRKPKHQRQGQQPYVLVRASGGVLCERGAQLLEEAAERVRAAPTLGTAPVRPSGPIGRPMNAPTPAQAYRAIAEPLIARYGTTIDYSKLDWMVCKSLACSSMQVDQAYLEEALLTGSPAMDDRKLGHTGDYAKRTAANVLQDPRVIAARERLTQSAATQRGRGVSE